MPSKIITKSKELLAFFTFLKVLIIGTLLFLAIDAYITLSTDVLSIETQANTLTPQTEINFTQPVSRMIVTVTSTPPAEYDISWDKSIYKNTMYRELIIEPKEELQNDTEYTVTVNGLRTVDRIKKIPLEFSFTTPE